MSVYRMATLTFEEKKIVYSIAPCLSFWSPEDPYFNKKAEQEEE